MAEGQKEWKAAGEAEFYQGVLYHNGKKVWTCTHQKLHETKAQAARCALNKLKNLPK